MENFWYRCNISESLVYFVSSIHRFYTISVHTTKTLSRKQAKRYRKTKYQGPVQRSASQFGSPFVFRISLFCLKVLTTELIFPEAASLSSINFVNWHFFYVCKALFFVLQIFGLKIFLLLVWILPHFRFSLLPAHRSSLSWMLCWLKFVWGSINCPISSRNTRHFALWCLIYIPKDGANLSKM